VVACRINKMELSQIDQKTWLMHFIPFFVIAALSLMGYKGLEPIDPVYALPVKVMQQIRRHQKQ